MTASAPDPNGNVVPLRRPAPRVNASCAEAARYLAQMMGELEQLANTTGLEMVSYFLSMARAEAASIANAAPPDAPSTTSQAPYRPD